MADDRTPDEETGRERTLMLLMAGVLLFAKSPNAFHIFSKEAYGFGSVAIEPGYKLGTDDRNCSFTAILKTSKTTSTPGARVRTPVTAGTNTRNPRLKSPKRRARVHAETMQPCVALPRVDAVEVRHCPAKQELKGLRTGRSLLDVSRHLPKTIIDQGGHVGDRGLVRGEFTCECSMEREVPTGNTTREILCPRCNGRRCASIFPSWVPEPT